MCWHKANNRNIDSGYLRLCRDGTIKTTVYPLLSNCKITAAAYNLPNRDFPYCSVARSTSLPHKICIKNRYAHIDAAQDASPTFFLQKRG